MSYSKICIKFVHISHFLPQFTPIHSEYIEGYSLVVGGVLFFYVQNFRFYPDFNLNGKKNNLDIIKHNIMDENQNPPGQQQINIELDEKTAEGTYSNLVIITHSPAEFIMDFTRVVPGVPKAKVQSRIIMTPQHAKLFLNALGENIKRYETQFGDIKIHNQIADGGLGFQPPTNPKDEKIN